MPQLLVVRWVYVCNSLICILMRKCTFEVESDRKNKQKPKCRYWRLPFGRKKMHRNRETIPQGWYTLFYCPSDKHSFKSFFYHVMKKHSLPKIEKKNIIQQSIHEDIFTKGLLLLLYIYYILYWARGCMNLAKLMFSRYFTIYTLLMNYAQIWITVSTVSSKNIELSHSLLTATTTRLSLVLFMHVQELFMHIVCIQHDDTDEWKMHNEWIQCQYRIWSSFIYQQMIWIGW